MAKKRTQADTAPNFIDTPAGIFTTSGNWFHITTAGLHSYAPGLFENTSISELLSDAEIWIRSGDNLSILMFMVLIFTSPLAVAVSVPLIFLPVWHLNKSALASPSSAFLMRFLDKEFVVVLASVAALSLLGIHQHYEALTIGFVLFFLFKFGWYRKFIDALYEKKSSGKLTLNDRLLRMMVLKYAHAEGINVIEVEKMEKDFLRLIQQQKEQFKRPKSKK